LTEAIAAIASAIIAWIVAGGALVQWYLNRRSNQLRLSEVASWAERSIAALQSVYLICALDEGRLEPGRLKAKADDLIFETSILVEQGRLFFRNVLAATYGKEKPEAYRGLRPRILDQLVIANQVVCAWQAASADERRKLALVAYDAAREFVSLIRQEVGRDAAVASGASQGGTGVWLPQLLNTKSSKSVSDHQWP
jgi:hypothetical protein